MLQDLIDFYSANSLNPFIMILAFWLFWPGLMFITAAILESRRVHLGKGQSRMFMPGDFMLGIGVVNFIGMNAHDPIQWSFYNDRRYWAITAIVFFVLAMIIRRIDTKRYPKRSANSPTKWAHDLAGYFVCFWLLSALGVPRIVWALKDINRAEVFTGNNWINFFAIAAFFVLMTLWDVTHPASDADLLKMHPSDWKPCWK